MILNAGILDVRNLLRGNSAGKKVSAIAVGTSAADVIGTETSLTGQIAKAVSSASLLDGGYLLFTSVLEGTDPAMVIKEIGLVSDDGTLLYRQVINPITKVLGVSYSLNYKIKVQ